jgi:translocation and assembly module TamB
MAAFNIDLVANRVDANGLYRARLSLADGVLTGAADIEEPPAGLLAGLLGLNDVGPIEAHLTGSGPRDANAIELTLTAGPLRASGRGIVNLIARTVQLDFSATAPDMALRPDLAWQSLAAEGQLRGSFDTPDVNAMLDVRNLRVRNVSVDGVTSNVTGRTGNLNFNASLAGLRLPGAEPDMFARTSILARGTIDLRTPARPFTVSLSHPLLTIDARGSAGATTSMQANISVPRLAPFAERGGVDLDGRATLNATIDQIGDNFRIAANGTIGAAGSEKPLGRLIGGNARVVLNATVSGRTSRSRMRGWSAPRGTRFPAA